MSGSDVVNGSNPEVMDVSTPEGRAKVAHLLIMVHGIRDFGQWQTELKSVLPASGIATVSIWYGYFDLFRFLFPFSWFRSAAIDKVARRVREAQKLYPNARYSYLAHSFGTYVVGKMLLEDPNFQAHRIIFCGSVLPADFPIAQLRCNFDPPLLNDVGAKDIWPILADKITWGYGSAGSTGFGQPNVEDRFHNHGHGNFLTADFARQFWTDFLTIGTIKPGIVPPQSSFLRRAAFVFPLKYLLLLAIAAFGAYWFTERPDLACTEKWLSQKEYDDCFEIAKQDKAPRVVEGRRSWFGFGGDVLKARWVAASYRACFYSKSVMDWDEFVEWNGDLSQKGYYPISVRSFLNQEDVESVQATWWKKGCGKPLG
jgi:hypothetical protein